jgi:hypothetical protein
VGAGAVSQAVPLLGIPCRSAPPVYNGSKLGDGGAIPESCDEVIVSFILFSLFSEVPAVIYRHG